MDDTNQASQIQFLISDFSTRLKDVEERNNTIKERLLLIGQNLITIKEQTELELQQLKKQVNEMQKDLNRVKSMTEEILGETGKFVRREEVVLIERMLRDFQPLEFVREKDVIELINQKLSENVRKSNQNFDRQINKNQDNR